MADDSWASVTMQDGRTLTGWRAMPLILLFMPLWLPWIVLGSVLVLVLTIGRWLTGSDRLLGFTYDGAGQWVRG